MPPAAPLIKTISVCLPLHVSTFLQKKAVLKPEWGAGGTDWDEILRWNGGMSHTLSKSSLCVYISDGCVKILLGWGWRGNPHSSQF